MARVYKPVRKKRFTCLCGCRRHRLGNKNAQYYEAACRVKMFQRRKRQALKAAA